MVYVCQVVVVALSIRHTQPAAGVESIADGLHVLVRTSESQGARSEAEWVLPRRWAGRPTDLGFLARGALDHSGMTRGDAPVGSAAAMFDQAASLRPAGGLLSVVAAMLLPHDRLLAPGWEWCPVTQVDPVLGHWDRTAVSAARGKAREMLRDTDTVLRLLPHEFRLSELRGIYEAHWGTALDASNFAKRALARSAKDFLKAVEREHGKPGRPATLYKRGRGPAPRLAPP